MSVVLVVPGEVDLYLVDLWGHSSNGGISIPRLWEAHESRLRPAPKPGNVAAKSPLPLNLGQKICKSCAQTVQVRAHTIL